MELRPVYTINSIIGSQILRIALRGEVFGLYTNIDVELAKEILLERVENRELEEVCLEDSLDRILACSVYSNSDIPSFRKSALDGFAFNHKDTEGISGDSKAFEIAGYIGAGSNHIEGYRRDTAIKIMTGAPVPEGYDCVIRKEDVEESEGKVYLKDSLRNCDNVAQIGEDISVGELIAEKGKAINAGIIGVLAGLGIEKVKVYSKPKIGILNTGKEIVQLGNKLEDGQIYNSNYYTLSALVRKMDCIPVNFGIVTDDIEEISKKIESSIDGVEMILTTGGASVGDYDFIYDVYKNLGAQVLFKRVDVKPGTPMLSAYYKDKLLIGLSGNPGAAFISFDYIVSSVIKKAKGEVELENRKVKAILKNDYGKKSKRRRLIRAYFEIGETQNTVEIMKKQKSGTLKSLIECNCLIDVEASSDGLKSGDLVEVVLLEGRDLI